MNRYIHLKAYMNNRGNLGYEICHIVQDAVRSGNRVKSNWSRIKKQALRNERLVRE